MKKNMYYRKPRTILVASLAFTLSLGTMATAAPSDTKTMNAADQTGVAQNLLVPVRVIAESLGALVTWSGESNSVTISKGNTIIVLKIGDDSARVNGKDLPIGRSVELLENSTMVPLSFISQALNSQIRWDAEKQTVVPVKDDLTVQAALFVYNMIQGNTAAILQASSKSLQEALTQNMLAVLMQQNQLVFGNSNKQLSSRVEENGVHTNVIMNYETEKTPVPFEITVRFNKSGQIDDFGSVPVGAPSAYNPPSYDHPELYTEKEVVIGEGAFALPGTLTVPKGEGPFSAVVLVHGSGPQDRDSSYGSTRTFKDIAAGLASQGIAVLRYEKMTKEHKMKASANDKFTLYDDSVADVFKAISLLNKTAAINPKRIFVAGHSQGGYAVPLMLQNDKAGQIAGTVLLSANSQNISDVVVEQQLVAVERMKKLQLPAEYVSQQEKAAAFYKNMVDMIKNPSYSKDNLPPQFQLPQAYWWFEQRDYKPTEMAKNQTTPMLILQGENDWQVSMGQYGLWQEALKARKNVEYKSYPKVNHFLTEYDGISVGMEYGKPANVSAQIVTDIAQWVKKQ